MRQSPQTIADDLKEMLCTYLETAYRISHPAIVAERASLLRESTTTSQVPYIETTPRYRAGRKLHDLVDVIPHLPRELPELTQFGLPTKYPLYQHQEDALHAAWRANGRPGDLIVATGTGSGKTESFYLPILADLLREALRWAAPKGAAQPGHWHSQSSRWLHARRHERRPAAVRALVLYPMNALVNDQLRRLRKTLASDGALAWQQRQLHGNLLYFGRYTGQTALAGTPDNDRRRKRWREYEGEIEAGWDAIGDDLRASGGWPRPGGPELLCRWDMQAAPPDILVTNYSMLEYMLVRPLEARIFDLTREWLAASRDHIFTLVLDEAHTYTGARGTEVAYLLRRLVERLRVHPDQLRCVATSASLGEGEEATQRIKQFAGELFGRDRESFTVIRAKQETLGSPLAPPQEHDIRALATFQQTLARADAASDENATISTAAQHLFDSLQLTPSGADTSAQLHAALEQFPQLLALRQETARRARQFDDVATAVWGDLANAETRRDALAGLLAAGAYARPSGLADPDVAPLLPSRLHLMFRGLPGLWACINPNCSVAPPTLDGESRPLGKLYAAPRIWCECGARVLEVFSCRICGLLFLGGVPESSGNDGRLWPYEHSLDGGLQDYEKYRVFAVENPGASRHSQHPWAEEYRSTHTSGIVNSSAKAGSRLVWVEPKKPKTADEGPSAWPSHCPRCQAARSGTRQVIEPLRSTGSQSFAVLTEQIFRAQPARTQAPVPVTSQPTATNWFTALTKQNPIATPAHNGDETSRNANRGRKALAFSDGRQDAAMLAGSLTYLHARDLFRQLLLVTLDHYQREGTRPDLPVPELRRRLFDLCVERGIDPTFGELDNFWSILRGSVTQARDDSAIFIDTYLRREIADRQVGVEALGLARWVIDVGGAELQQKIPPLAPLDERETVALLYATLRILASENVLLPFDLNPLTWPPELVEAWAKRVVLKPPYKDGNAFTWSPDTPNRLTRYLTAVAEVVGIGNRGLGSFMDTLFTEYLEPAEILLNVANPMKGWGIPLNRLALAPLPEFVHVCSECGYINAEAVRSICIRCHNICREVPSSSLSTMRNNYYVKLAQLAVQPSGYPDPFPLRALEHTAQISADKAAERERHFQDQFIEEGAEKEDPAASRVDILSVTTTMEMGIDIGDLIAVGLHNTPPTVANYQQRAGRAGRRSDGVATVLTYARDRSHDQYYFSRVTDIVTGQVRIPQVHLANDVIARRHVHALALQQFFHHYALAGNTSNLFASFGTIAQFRGPVADQLRQLLAGSPFSRELAAAARRIVPRHLDKIDAWLSSLPDEIDRCLDNAADDDELLTILITRGALPRYAFPTDVVALWLQKPSKYTFGEEIQRDLQIALSEYAPEAEIIVDGQIHHSVGLYTPYTEQPNYRHDAWYYECPVCHAVKVHPHGGQAPTWTSCDVCGEAITNTPGKRPSPAIRPAGFRTDWNETKKKKYRGGGRERAGFASDAQLHAGENAFQGHAAFDGRLWIRQRNGDLYMMNRGPEEQPGFWICPQCGRNLEKKSQAHKRPDGSKYSCGGRPEQRSVLMHHFTSDVALLTVDLPPALSANPRHADGRAVWLSFGHALLRAAAAELQIDASELAVGVRPLRHPDGRLQGEVFLYDTLPNGAGYAQEVIAELPAILRRARDLVSTCSGNCESSCYNCLLDYSNQRSHALLDRHLAKALLDYTLDGILPDLAPTRVIAAVEHLRHFVEPDHFHPGAERDGTRIPALIERPGGNPVSVWPIHTLTAPTQTAAVDLMTLTGTRPILVSEFNLQRRPFWVWDRLAEGKSGWVQQ